MKLWKFQTILTLQFWTIELFVILLLKTKMFLHDKITTNR